MKLFIKVFFLIAISYAVSLLINERLLAGDNETGSSDDLIAVEVMPEMIVEVKPVYPDNLADTKGEVYIKAFVNKEGNVIESKLAKSSGVEEFDSSALNAALKCKYKPAMSNGEPIEVWVTYKVEFTPSGVSTERSTDNNILDTQEINIMPEMIYEKAPVYPKEAKENEIEGTTWIKALVGKEGVVIKAEIHKSSGSNLLDKSALSAAWDCKYKPAIIDDKPVATWITYKVEFVLSSSDDEIIPE